MTVPGTNLTGGTNAEVDVAQAAELTGLSPHAIRSRIRRRSLIARMRDGRHRIAVAELRERELVVPGDRYRSLSERVTALEDELRATVEARERAEQQLKESASKVRVLLGAKRLEAARATEVSKRPTRWPWRRGADRP